MNNISMDPNATLFFYDEEYHDHHFTDMLNMIQGSIYIPIFIAGLANNFLTVLIILLNRDMRTVTNCYLLNLAISDTLPLIVSLPFEISFLPTKVPWGRIGCQLRALLAETSTNASILTISAFTVERYQAVCRPLRTSSISTISRAIRVQILIWFVAILSSTPYFYLIARVEDQCRFDPNLQLFVTICFRVSATVFFVLPAFILCFLYAFMAQRLYTPVIIQQVQWTKAEPNNADAATHLPLTNGRSSNQHLPSHRPSTTSLCVTRNGTGSSPGLTSHTPSMKKSAFKMLFAVVIAFIICYAPFHVQRLITSRLDVLYLSLVQQRAIAIFYFISGILYYLGSTINPIFYHLFSSKYRVACRRTMKRIIQCNRHSRPSARKMKHSTRAAKTPQLLTSNTNQAKINVDIGQRSPHTNYLSTPTCHVEKQFR